MMKTPLFAMRSIRFCKRLFCDRLMRLMFALGQVRGEVARSVREVDRSAWKVHGKCMESVWKVCGREKGKTKEARRKREEAKSKRRTNVSATTTTTTTTITMHSLLTVVMLHSSGTVRFRNDAGSVFPRHHVGEHQSVCRHLCRHNGFLHQIPPLVLPIFLFRFA